MDKEGQKWYISVGNGPQLHLKIDKNRHNGSKIDKSGQKWLFFVVKLLLFDVGVSSESKSFLTFSYWTLSTGRQKGKTINKSL